MYIYNRHEGKCMTKCMYVERAATSALPKPQSPPVHVCIYICTYVCVYTYMYLCMSHQCNHMTKCGYSTCSNIGTTQAASTACPCPCGS